MAKAGPMPDHLEAVRRAAATLRDAERATDKARETLRLRMIAAARAGANNSEIARAAGVSRQWVGKIVEEG